MNKRLSSRRQARALLLALCVVVSGTALAADPQASRYYEDALQRFDKRDFKGAIIQLKNALQANNLSLPVQLLLGKALLADGQPGAAETALSEALRLGVNRAEVVVDLAQSLVDQGKHAALLADGRFAETALPRGVQAKLMLLKASAAADLGSLREAYRLIGLARDAAPESADSWLAEASLRIRERRFDDAWVAVDRAAAVAGPSAAMAYQRAQIRHVSGRVQDALAAYGEALRLDPAHVESLLGRAGLLIDLERHDEARRDVAEVRRLAPEEPRGAYLDALQAERIGDTAKTRQALKEVTSLIDPVPLDFVRYKPQILMLAGLAHYGLGEREAAKPYLEAYQRQDPGSGVSKLLARVLLGEGNADLAVDVLEQYLRRSPADAQAQALLAAGHMALGRPARAVAIARDALKAQDSPELRAVLGVGMLRAGQPRDALAEFEAIYRKNPGLVGPASALAGLYLQTGQGKKALAVANDLVKRQPGSAGMLTLQAHARLAVGDRAGARAAFAEAARADSALIAPQIALARLDAAGGQVDVATRRLTDALSRHERNTELQMELAAQSARAGRPEDARRWLERAVESADTRDTRPAVALVDLQVRQGRLPEALEAAKLLASKAANDLVSHMTLARVQIATKDREGARASLNTATRLAAFDAADQVEIGLLQMHIGHLDGAAYSFDKALSDRPDFLPALAARAEVDLRRGALAEAEQRARALAQAHPKLAVGVSLLGEVAWARGDVAAAAGHFRRAHQLSPDSDSLIRLLHAVRRQQTVRDAVTLGEQWLSKQPTDHKVRAVLAALYRETGDLPAARRHYEHILHSRPDDATVLNELANVLLVQDKAAALPVAERAARAAPGQALVLDTLGWVLLHNGQTERALQVLREARLREPGHPEIRYHLAAALAQSGKPAEARAELRDALAGSPRFEGVEAAHKLLQSLP